MRLPPPRPLVAQAVQLDFAPVSTSFPVQLFALGKPAWVHGP